MELVRELCNYYFSFKKSFRRKFTVSLKKLYYFQLSFLENCVCTQNKSIKDPRNCLSNIFFKVFANSVSVLHSKI